MLLYTARKIDDHEVPSATHVRIPASKLPVASCNPGSETTGSGALGAKEFRLRFYLDTEN